MSVSNNRRNNQTFPANYHLTTKQETPKWVNIIMQPVECPAKRHSICMWNLCRDRRVPGPGSARRHNTCSDDTSGSCCGILQAGGVEPKTHVCLTRPTFHNQALTLVRTLVHPLLLDTLLKKALATTERLFSLAF